MTPSPQAQNYPSEGEEEEEHPLLSPQSYDDGTGQGTIRRKRGCLESGPDGLLAWIVAFANFIINLIIVGLGRMSGILYVVFMEMFHVNRQTAALPFSIQQAARNLFGSLAGILGQKYGVRAVTMGGGVIGVISAVVCFFSTSMNWITIMWGLVFGICTALTTTLNQVTIDQYFVRYQTTAGGLAFSGGCVGAFLFPGLLEWLIQTYGMSRTFLAMAIVIAIVVPAAVVLRDPPWKKKNSEHPEVDQVKGRKGSSNYNTFNAAVPSTVAHRFSQSLIDEDFIYLEEQREIVYQLILLTLFDGGDDMLATQWVSVAVDPIVQELFALYHFLRYEPSLSAARNISRASQIGSLTNEMTHDIHIVQVTNPGCAATHEFQSYEDNPRWVFLTSKLRDLSDRNESDVLSYFDHVDHPCVIRVFNLLKKLDSLVRNSSIMNTDSFKISDDDSFQKNKLLNANKSRIFDQYNEQPVTSFDALPNGSQNSSELSATSTRSAYVTSDEESKSKFEDCRTFTSNANFVGASPNDTQSSATVTMANESRSSTSKRSKRNNKTKPKDSNSFMTHIRTAIQLHRNPLFLLICLCRGVFMLTFIPMVTIVVDFATDQGLKRASGKYVIAALSLGDLLGRLCLGWINDIGCISLSRYMLLAMLLLGCSTATLPLMRNELSMMPSVLVFGMLQGSLFIRHQVLVSKYMEGHEQTIGMGFINMLSGFLGFALPSYIGYFRDTQGSYDGMLYVNGAICACVGLLWILEPFFTKWTGRELSYNKIP